MGKPEISCVLTDLQMYKIHVCRLAKCFNANTCFPESFWAFTLRAPADMIHTSAKTLIALKKDYDEFGDRYSQDTSPEQLKYTFQHMENVGIETGKSCPFLQCTLFSEWLWVHVQYVLFYNKSIRHWCSL